MIDTVFVFLWLALIGWIFDIAWTPLNLVESAVILIVLDILKDWVAKRFA